MYRSELNAKLEMYVSACQSIGLDVSWDGLAAEPSNDRLDMAAAAAAAQLGTSSQGGTTGPAVPTASAIAEEVQAEASQPLANGTAAAGGKKSSAGGRPVGGNSSSSGAEPSSTEAAVEALAAALPLRLSGMGSMLRTSTQDRKGELTAAAVIAGLLLNVQGLCEVWQAVYAVCESQAGLLRYYMEY